MTAGKEFYSLLRTSGGFAGEYEDIIETDFAAANGTAYVPPEGDAASYRRINVLRTIQILSQCPVVIETFQTSGAFIRLPHSSSTVSLDDAGNGRHFVIKNSGVGNLTIQDSQGVNQRIITPLTMMYIEGNKANNWDFLDGNSMAFDNSTNGFLSTRVQPAIEEAKQNAEGFPRAGLPLTYNGTVGAAAWINYTELLANPRILFPVKIRLKEISWNNNNVNLGAFTFEFYKNGQVKPTNLIYTYTPTALDRTKGYGSFSFPTDIDINGGEFIYVKNVRPSGTALSDLALVIWISRIP